MAEKEIAALRQTLHTQQKLLHHLYADLEAEREASIISANETLSMISRLQGEKAADKLEATHFKRMAEEKMNHAQEIMEVFEETMHQKDMEIASLAFQLQAYRYKMLSMGLSDSEIEDLNSGECFLMPQNNFHPGIVGDHGLVRRIHSLPAIRSKPSITSKDVLPTERPEITPSKLSPRVTEEDLDCEFEVHRRDVQNIRRDSAGSCDLSSYWEQIKELDEKVDESSGGEVIQRSEVIHRRTQYNQISSNNRCRSTGLAFPEELQLGCRKSLNSRRSGPTRGRTVESELDYERTFKYSDIQSEDPETMLQVDNSSIPSLETENVRSPSQFISIHDVYEVPQNNESDKLCQPLKQDGKKFGLEGRLGMPDPIPHGTKKYCRIDEAGGVKSSLQCVNDDNKWTKQRERVSVNCHMALVALRDGVFPFQTDFQQLNKRLEKLEGERRVVKQGVSGHEEGELKLLKEMHEQLNKIQCQIGSTKARRDPAAEEPSLVSLMEAMFFYSL